MIGTRLLDLDAHFRSKRYQSPRLLAAWQEHELRWVLEQARDCMARAERRRRHDLYERDLRDACWYLSRADMALAGRPYIEAVNGGFYGPGY